MEQDNIVDERKKKKGILAKPGRMKHRQIFIALVVILVAVVAYTLCVSDKDKVTSLEATDAVSLTAQLEEVLGAIKGVGDVKLLIVYNGGDRLDLAYRTDKHTTVVTDENGRTETVEEVTEPILTSGKDPLVVGTVRAEIYGILVVCDGGDDQKVRVAVMHAIATLLKVDYNCINVLKMA